MASSATTNPKANPELGQRCRVGRGAIVWIVTAVSDGYANLTKEGSNGYVNTTAAVERLVLLPA